MTHTGLQSRLTRGPQRTAARIVLMSGTLALAAGLPEMGPAQTVCPTEPEEMCDLGTLRDDDGGFGSARDISSAGLVVVGVADAKDGDRHAFRWNSDTGAITYLGTLRADDSGDSFGLAVNADGAVIVGQAEDDSNVRAFRWSSETGEMTDLGTLRADDTGFSSARDVSADGSVVVGVARTEDRGYKSRVSLEQ